MKRKKKTVSVSFVEECSVLPFIHIEFSGDKSVKTALVDTGSEITLLDNTLQESLKDSPSLVVSNSAGSVSISGFGGEGAEKAASSFAAKVKIKNTDGEEAYLPVKGTMVDMWSVKEALKKNGIINDIVMIIGSDTLKNLKAKIDYKQKVVVFNDILCD